MPLRRLLPWCTARALEVTARCQRNRRCSNKIHSFKSPLGFQTRIFHGLQYREIVHVYYHDKLI